ncbi:SAM-dependent methyltransferase [Luteolibacter flavescens]|uniref:SAM-dependent methyltransferase n=1 Tax=Luteolibacter flavescens TaxID=1859460 RepID=A0ABT3FUV3_9BACT|nr:SAM-dependent methyltransferase [Luteolibacter flavescens]MCW1887348.1 SAM-dependent methyltransferase [Luteolibacter flavescens]
MAAALYDPAEGYYGRPAGQVGKAGDFITSVSVGPLFGRLLARHIASWHQQAGSPERWRIIETGANDSSLAGDIISTLERLSADAGLEYAIIEPLPRLAQDQRKRLPGVAIVESAEAFAGDPLPSFVFGNEVIDALPFHVIESDGIAWIEQGVTVDDAGAFAWHPLGPAAAEVVGNLPVMPAGYRTEIRCGVRDFLRPLAAAMAGGRMLWIDYGFPQDDYYHEARTTGTLRTFSRHRAGEDPLDSPGEIDITAHVDFTALARDLDATGGQVVRFEPQGSFLTRVASPWLLEMEGRTDDTTKKELRAFQTLTHPGHLGSRFHVMEAAF